MQRYQFNQQRKNSYTFYTPIVVNARCIVVSKKHPDAGIKCDCVLDNFSQPYGEIVS